MRRTAGPCQCGHGSVGHSNSVGSSGGLRWRWLCVCRPASDLAHETPGTRSKELCLSPAPGFVVQRKPVARWLRITPPYRGRRTRRVITTVAVQQRTERARAAVRAQASPAVAGLLGSVAQAVVVGAAVPQGAHVCKRRTAAPVPRPWWRWWRWRWWPWGAGATPMLGKPTRCCTALAHVAPGILAAVQLARVPGRVPDVFEGPHYNSALKTNHTYNGVKVCLFWIRDKGAWAQNTSQITMFGTTS